MDVSASFVDVHEVQSGPQRGTRYEYVPPTPAYMGQRDQVVIKVVFVVFVVFAIVIRDEPQNIRGDPVYGRERVPQGPNQTEDFHCVLFESDDLKITSMNRCAHQLFTRHDLNLVRSRGIAAGVIRKFGEATTALDIVHTSDRTWHPVASFSRRIRAETESSRDLGSCRR